MQYERKKKKKKKKGWVEFFKCFEKGRFAWRAFSESISVRCFSGPGDGLVHVAILCVGHVGNEIACAMWTWLEWLEGGGPSFTREVSWIPIISRWRFHIVERTHRHSSTCLCGRTYNDWYLCPECVCTCARIIQIIVPVPFGCVRPSTVFVWEEWHFVFWCIFGFWTFHNSALVQVSVGEFSCWWSYRGRCIAVSLLVFLLKDLIEGGLKKKPAVNPSSRQVLTTVLSMSLVSETAGKACEGRLTESRSTR